MPVIKSSASYAPSLTGVNISILYILGINILEDDGTINGNEKSAKPDLTPIPERFL